MSETALKEDDSELYKWESEEWCVHSGRVWLADRSLSLKVRAQVYNLNDLQKRKGSFVFVDSQQRQKKVYFVLFSTTKFLVCVQKHYVLKITYVSVKPFVAFCM